ncbi:MAG: lamin tail domain-containing protein [Candidatus Brennerbacteria bacterium]|nr:lamin tail domain-containing protein [Candidatus Brennerbacteria bacterium]
MIINRFLPNPVGPDTAGEWIEIFNNGSAPVNLAGWRIKDLAGKSYVFKSGELKAGSALQLPYKATKITLNNSGETLFLYDSNGRLANKLSFSGAAAEGQIISYNYNVDKNILSAPTAQNTPLANTLFFNHIIFINLTFALILSSMFFWIIKNLYADYFEPGAAGN